jgi:hypothetical protein
MGAADCLVTKAGPGTIAEVSRDDDVTHQDLV